MSGMFRITKNLRTRQRASFEKGSQEERQIVICPNCQKELDRTEGVENNYICMTC